jgi:hypothetical protein
VELNFSARVQAHSIQQAAVIFQFPDAAINDPFVQGVYKHELVWMH